MDIGKVVDEFLAPVPPLPVHHLIMGGRLVPVDPSCGLICNGDMLYFNAETGMIEKVKPKN